MKSISKNPADRLPLCVVVFSLISFDAAITFQL